MIKLSFKDIRVEIDILFFIALPVMFWAGYLMKFTLIFFSILLHEIGHIISAALLGDRILSIRILPVGLNVVTVQKTACKWHRVLIYFSGPLINILLFLIFTKVRTYYLFHSDNMLFFITMNIYLAIFNLLPVLPLDGGKIIRELLAERVGLLLASRYVKRSSRLLAVFFLLLGLLQWIRNIYNFSIILIGIYIFFALQSEEAEAAMMNIKNVIFRRSRLLKKGIYPARELVAIKSIRLGEVLKHMDFDRFHIVYILDDELKVIRTFTEQEIMDGLLQYNGDLTFDEYIHLLSSQ